jgi:hypothetical protein
MFIHPAEVYVKDNSMFHLEASISLSLCLALTYSSCAKRQSSLASMSKISYVSYCKAPSRRRAVRVSDPAFPALPSSSSSRSILRIFAMRTRSTSTPDGGFVQALPSKCTDGIIIPGFSSGSM